MMTREAMMATLSTQPTTALRCTSHQTTPMQGMVAR